MFWFVFFFYLTVLVRTALSDINHACTIHLRIEHINH
jgi:hypothetical protein